MFKQLLLLFLLAMTASQNGCHNYTGNTTVETNSIANQAFVEKSTNPDFIYFKQGINWTNSHNELEINAPLRDIISHVLSTPRVLLSPAVHNETYHVVILKNNDRAFASFLNQIGIKFSKKKVDMQVVIISIEHDKVNTLVKSKCKVDPALMYEKNPNPDDSNSAILSGYTIDQVAKYLESHTNVIYVDETKTVESFDIKIPNHIRPILPRLNEILYFPDSFLSAYWGIRSVEVYYFENK